MTTPPGHDKPSRAKIAAMGTYYDPQAEGLATAPGGLGPPGYVVTKTHPPADLTTLVQRLERAVERLKELPQ